MSYIPYIFYYCQQVLVTLTVSSLLLSLNDTSADIADVEGSFKFALEAELNSPLYVYITLAADTEA